MTPEMEAEFSRCPPGHLDEPGRSFSGDRFQLRRRLALELEQGIAQLEGAQRPVWARRAYEQFPMSDFYATLDGTILLRIYGFAQSTTGALLARTMSANPDGLVGRTIGGRLVSTMCRMPSTGWTPAQEQRLWACQEPAAFLDPLAWTVIIRQLHAAGEADRDIHACANCDCEHPGHVHHPTRASPPPSSSTSTASASASAKSSTVASTAASAAASSSSQPTTEAETPGEAEDRRWYAYCLQWRASIAAMPVGPRPGKTWADAGDNLERVEQMRRERRKNGEDKGQGDDGQTCHNARCCMPLWASRALACTCHLGVFYCSPECQKVDRCRHKKRCTVKGKPKQQAHDEDNDKGAPVLSAATPAAADTAAMTPLNLSTTT